MKNTSEQNEHLLKAMQPKDWFEGLSPEFSLFLSIGLMG